MTPGPVLPAPPLLADCVRPAMVNAVPAVDYHLPASLHPMLLAVPGGRLFVRRAAGFEPLPRLSLCGATRSAQLVRSAQGTRIVTVSIQSGQLPRLFDVDGWTIAGQCVSLDSLLRSHDRPLLRACESRLDAARTPQAEVAAVWQLLASLHHQRSQRASNLRVPMALMHAPARQIATQLGIGARQFERRFLASHGQSLRSFRHQLRCSQALISLIDHGGVATSWAEHALDAGYGDQSHLHRDVMRFTGVTPGRLASGIANGDPRFWPYLAARQRVQALFGPTGY